jgi:hypothetical protein
MNDKFIPEAIAQFIIDKIDSVAELEALLLLRGNPHDRWTPQNVSKRLYLSDKDAFEVLVALSTKGVVLYKSSDSGWYEYQPGSPDVGQLVDRLFEIYPKQIVPITNLIHSKSKQRIKEFAAAFKMRKDED